MDTYLVFHIVGFNRQDELGNLHDKVVIRLIDTNYENALQRAMLIIDKPFWILAEVVEFKEESYDN